MRAVAGCWASPVTRMSRSWTCGRSGLTCASRTPRWRGAMPDAQGKFKGISVPDVPWKRVVTFVPPNDKENEQDDGVREPRGTRTVDTGATTPGRRLDRK